MESPFSQKLQKILNDGMLSLGLAMGHELKLFDAIADVSSEEKPATSDDIASKANMKERYVREWLCMMACGGIIEVDESGKKFWIKEENISHLCGENPGAVLVLQQSIFMSAKAYPMIAKLFSKDGPKGMEYSMFDEFGKRMAAFSASMHKDELITGFIPCIGMQDRLQDGGLNVLDVGCGRGVHVTQLARQFPSSTFIGIDLAKEAIDGAKQMLESEEKDVTNLTFMQMNAQKLEKDWTEKFDWVMIFDACHDQTRPDLCLKEIHRVLKPGGIFSMIEVNGTSNVYKDKCNELSTFIYGLSLFHCLAVGSNSEDALCVGAMWGQEKAKELLTAAGFHDIEIKKSPFLKVQFNILYLCRK